MCMSYVEKDFLNWLKQIMEKLRSFPQKILLEPSFGVYLVEDSKIPVDTMYARATMAAKKCKKEYLTHVSYYDDSMTNQMLEEQHILSDMQKALDQPEFVIYIQPKFDLQTKVHI